ncbi:MAG TPA: hypothetical protein PKE29_02180 [Phycisphaerales bacterium]|jgi:hypothetical protein|nr:hypothetical protein [Phycisphaerales bacterium]
MSTIAAIADAVAAHINAGTFSQPVNAARMYQPAFTLEDLAELRVSVVPRTVGISAASRDSSVFECVIDVGVQKKLPADGADGEIDALLDLVEEITDHLRLKRLPDAPEAAWAGIAHEPVVSSESLEQHRVFTSVLSVTYRVRR